MAYLVEGNRFFERILPRPNENVCHVVFRGVTGLQFGRQRCESPINALGTAATVPLGLRLKHRVRTRTGGTDQLGCLMSCETCHHFRFCFDQKGIVHGKIGFNHRGRETGQKMQG